MTDQLKPAAALDFGYARVSTTHQDLQRQIHALKNHGIPDDRLFVDKGRSRDSAHSSRPGWADLRSRVRAGDQIVAYTLDRIGSGMRETLNIAHELGENGIGLKTLADPLPIDTSDDSPTGQLSIAMLSLFSHMELVWSRERAAHAREVAKELGRQTGRPRTITPDHLATARREIAAGQSVTDIAKNLKISRAGLYKALARDNTGHNHQP